MALLQLSHQPVVYLSLFLLVLTATHSTSGELVLQEPMRPARVYASAPSRVEVTAVRVMDDSAPPSSYTPFPSARYFLHQSNLTDHRYFTIDQRHGNITTERYEDRGKGEEYRLIVLALVSGQAIYQEITVTVTEYNQYKPSFTQPSYSAEVLTTAESGLRVVSVEATDEDAAHYNRDLIYFLAKPSSAFTLNPFLDPPLDVPVKMEAKTGVVRVSDNLRLAISSSPLRLLVGVLDGGSPQRYALATLTVYIRDIPAPRDVMVRNTSESSLTVCWSPPVSGRPLGYMLSYTPSPGQHSLGKGSLNLTTDQLHSNMFPREPQRIVNTSRSLDQQPPGDVNVYRYCAVVGGLAKWTEYMVGVRAWTTGQVSIAATPAVGTTRNDYCAMGVCGEGNCTLQESSPGYTCSCFTGWYGHNCQHQNPCIPENPCMIGKCTNESDGYYTCECPRGFYGQNCSQIDPCAAVSSNPCSNGGSCISQESGEYTCICREGYFGTMCEHLDPCHPNPCHHRAPCTNLTHTEYFCDCPPGYTGIDCEVNMDDCGTSPCLNGATCLDGIAAFSCLCRPGYTGTRCEAEVNECNPNPCVRGTCQDHLNDFTCTCPEGWGGKTCEQDLDECASSPCFNGATCIDGLASYVCDCAHGYNGQVCDIPESCPAQTTRHNTGEFHWPITHHSQSITLSCPYGIRITTSELLMLPGFAHHMETPTDNTKSQKSDSPFGSQTMTNHHGPVQHNIEPHQTTRTGGKGWEEDSFSVKRRTRDVDKPATHQSGRRFTSVIEEESAQEARRRLVAESIRGTSQRLAERRYQHRRQRERKGTLRTQQKRKTPEVSVSEVGRTVEAPVGRAISSRRNRAHSQPSGRKMHFISDSEDIHPTDSRDSNAMANTQTGRSSAHPLHGDDIQSSVRNFHSQSYILATQVHTEGNQNGEHSRRQVLPVHLDQDHVKAPGNSPAKLTLRNYPQEQRGHDVSGHKHLRRMHASVPAAAVGVHEQLDSESSHIKDNHSAHRKSQHRFSGEGVENYRTNINDNPIMSPLMPGTSPAAKVGAERACVLLPNGTVAWMEPSTLMCREEAAQVAEDAAKDVATLTATPAVVNSEVFTQAANELTKIVPHALDDPAVASIMVDALSNMMAVNDSVVVAGNEESDVTSQIVDTINTFTENVVVKVGQSVRLRSENLVLEARMVDSSLNDSITFHPESEKQHSDSTGARKKRTTDSTDRESFLSLPQQILKMAGTKNVRLEFVSYASDKFFQGRRSSGLPVITARVTNTTITNLDQPVRYYIAVGDSALQPVCVFWNEQTHDWSDVGMMTLEEEGMLTCQATHLTAFSILLDPLPSELGVHATTLSIITYIGLFLSTAGLLATVATYALFRSLNRDRSGKVVMNLSLSLLLLNLVFIGGTQLQPTSLACTSVAALLHYLVMAAFAWMLVEAANMYQLLITVFASSETHFMAKRVVAAWGVPALPVVCALVWDTAVYGDTHHGHCVINPKPNPAVYYTTYLGPICLVLAVNCVVFVLVTRVLCQRRPRSHKPKSPTRPHTKEIPITLAQIRGAVTVVALLGVTWVAGALSVGGARLTLQYIFCLATPLQGLVIFIVRVAQHPEARASWLALLTEGTLKRRPQTTISHSTQSSAHTHSTSSSALMPLKGHSHTTSTRISLKGSVKSTISSQRNGSTRNYSSNRSGKIRKQSRQEASSENKSSIGRMFSHLVSRLNNDGLPEEKVTPRDNDKCSSPDITSKPMEKNAVLLPQDEYSSAILHQESYIKELLPQDSYYHTNSKNVSLGRPHSMVLLRTDSDGSVLRTQPATIPQSCPGSNLPPLLPHALLPQELLEAGIPSSMIPRRSLGSLMLYAQGKEGDDSSWHFVRPPPDGQSDPAPESETINLTAAVCTPTSDPQLATMKQQQVIQSVQGDEERSGKTTCIVLAGQRIATANQPIAFSSQQKGVLTRANSELYMSSPQVNPGPALRRSASVYTLGEWEDPRASLA